VIRTRESFRRRWTAVVVGVFLALTIAGIGAGVGLADQTPIGNLGKPSSTSHSSGIAEIGLLVPTDGCPGFSTGDSLEFVGDVQYRETGRFWDLPDPDRFIVGWSISHWTWDASQSSGGFTYALRANLDFSGYTYTEGGVDFGTGKLTVTRSDGAKMTGIANLFESDVESTAFFTWQGTPACS
jgi:hypothetical protein